MGSVHLHIYKKQMTQAPEYFYSLWTSGKKLKQAMGLILWRPASQAITANPPGFRNLRYTKCSRAQQLLVAVQPQWLLLFSGTNLFWRRKGLSSHTFCKWNRVKRCNIWSQNFCLPRQMELLMTIESLFLNIECFSCTVTWT